jgi:peptide/nickel transport system ATP-binding protein
VLLTFSRPQRNGSLPHPATTAAPPGGEALPVRVTDLSVTFQRRGVPVRALRGVSLEVRQREILAVVGESGSGKSVLGLTLLGLLGGNPAPETAGRAEVCGIDMVSAMSNERRRVRRDHMGAVFQDPMTSLNPTMKIGSQLREVAGSTREAIRLLELVGVPDTARRMNVYPYQLSGGLRQRVMLAMAVAGKPDLVIADEPTTALDVTVQAQVLSVLQDLRDEVGCSILLITHDFGVASQVADRIAVLYGGRLAEYGGMGEVTASPSHPYTAGLLNSRLDLDLPRDRHIATLTGEPPDPRDHPPGCAFAPRCPHRMDVCSEIVPQARGAHSHDGSVACFLDGPAAGLASGSAGATSAEARVFQAAKVTDETVVSLAGVGKDFQVAAGMFSKTRLAALRDVHLDVKAGESIAIVGESGSGKSTLLRTVAGLLPPDRGSVDLPAGKPQMVFQDARASLTPWRTVGDILSDRLRDVAGKAERQRRVRDALAQVGLPGEVAHAKAGQLSGGQCQRVAFARSVIVPPPLLLCDEPTSALDASLAGVVLNLLQRLRREHGMAVMFVTHDLAVARFIADRIVVMYLGEVVESGPADEVVGQPLHPYTKALLRSVPKAGEPPFRLQGEPASALAVPSGCAFHPRCSAREESCDRRKPELQPVAVSITRKVACVKEPAAEAALTLEAV